MSEITLELITIKELKAVLENTPDDATIMLANKSEEHGSHKIATTMSKSHVTTIVRAENFKMAAKGHPTITEFPYLILETVTTKIA